MMIISFQLHVMDSEEDFLGEDIDYEDVLSTPCYGFVKAKVIRVLLS